MTAFQGVLVVCGTVDLASGLATQIARLGHEVVGIAASASEAIAMTARTKPNLVLMDLGCDGDRDGVEAAEAIHRRWSIPVLLLSTHADDAPRASDTVASHLPSLVKPFTERELRFSIELALLANGTKDRALDVEEHFFTVAIDLLCCLDFSGYFKRLNPAWERTLGFTREELMAKPFIEFVHPDDRERTLRQNRVVRDGGQALGFENRYLCKDGSYKWLLWNAAPAIEHRAIYSVARDVTARREAEQEREKLVQMLQAALAEVKILREILPICSYCKNIRDDENTWHTVHDYVSRHTNTMFSHGICPTCYAQEVEPQMEELARRPAATEGG